MNRYLYIVILIILTNCAKKESISDFDKTIMQDIFLTLIDNSYDNLEFRLPPPPPYPELFYETESQEIKDSIIEITKIKYEQKVFEIEKRYENFKKGNQKILIVVSDTIENISSSYKERLIKHFENSKIEFDDSWDYYKTGYIIDLKNFRRNDKYVFKHSTSFPKQIWKWKLENNSDLKAVVSFSRIILDKSKNFGILTGGISYARLNGNGFIVFIKKENGKWVIDSKEGTWIS
ncbi:hypothetical protein R3X25_15010 [Lutibacter sp. TH_r2]|uniref:hypothetical protein n=1 Tax=Lutibacter sp. TH_r2 TaxID=3082083 RepID=UPI002953E700|nr:hypothetical protein [Lutibacter sp. TH_r2]MDV7188595.1 hypothetical protein [Lutibacter sp. TH_r2]